MVYQNNHSLFLLFVILTTHMILIGSFSISSLFVHNIKGRSISTKVVPCIRPFLPLQPIPQPVQFTTKHPSERLSREIASSFQSSSQSTVFIHSDLRILQFNILADGLSGLRDDFGAFSRVTRHDIIWENRRDRLLDEIIQYDPDVITLQECDHYYDFFLPKLAHFGYDGLYSPKPASACLQVSSNADGCCIFVKRKKLRICSAEVLLLSFL